MKIWSFYTPSRLNFNAVMGSSRFNLVQPKQRTMSRVAPLAPYCPLWTVGKGNGNSCLWVASEKGDGSSCFFCSVMSRRWRTDSTPGTLDSSRLHPTPGYILHKVTAHDSNPVPYIPTQLQNNKLQLSFRDIYWSLAFCRTIVRRADDFHAYCGLFSNWAESENVQSVYEIGIMYIGGLYGYTPLGTV